MPTDARVPAVRDWGRFGLLIAAVMVVSFGAGLGSHAYYAGRAAAAEAREPAAFAPFWEVWDHIQSEFYGEVPDQRTLTYGAIRGLLAEVGDPYTVLVEPQPHQEQKEQLQGHYGGIGAGLSRDESGVLRLSPFPDSPSAAAGVKLDDELLAIDGQAPAASESIDAIAARLRGEVGSAVALRLRRGGAAPFDVTVTRAEIAIPSLEWRLRREDATVGYVAIHYFSATTGAELRAALLALRAQGARRLVLDLRDNSGGLVQAAVDVTSEFVASGVVLYELTRSPSDTFLPVRPGGVASDLPLVVLVNGRTASAAEAVAGALQDHGRARLVGETTFGKGSVQLVHDLRDGSSLHVTAAKWLTPARRSIDGLGLAPDIAVSPSPADLAAGRDVQLLRALDVVQGK